MSLPSLYPPSAAPLFLSCLLTRTNISIAYLSFFTYVTKHQVFTLPDMSDEGFSCFIYGYPIIIEEAILIIIIYLQYQPENVLPVNIMVTITTYTPFQMMAAFVCKSMSWLLTYYAEPFKCA
jgi:hypothetical protein